MRKLILFGFTLVTSRQEGFRAEGVENKYQVNFDGFQFLRKR